MNDRAALVKGLRRMARPAGAQAVEPATAGEERCELCNAQIPSDHKHLLDLDDRRIVCTCSACWSMRSGDAKFRPAGARTLWLEGFDMPEELWAAFQIPVGLAFFLRASSVDRVVGLYPSPVGATECELSLEAWAALEARNPDLVNLEPDCEALLVNRMSDPPQFAVAPIDECYRLVGAIKAGWEGISGGDAVERAVPEFFANLRARALVR